jgi:two-component system sensor histidine kinase DegS
MAIWQVGQLRVFKTEELRKVMPRVRGLTPVANSCPISERQSHPASIEIGEAEHIILELHDGPAQTLTSAFQCLQTFDQIARPYFVQRPELERLFRRALGLVRQAVRETREIINGSAPATLEANGLVAVVRQELERLEEETGCRVDFYSGAWPTLNGEAELAIYRIISEALSNARKHAQSPRLEVEMSQKGKRLLVRVRDWGVGIAPARLELSPSGGCLGLLSMRRRTGLLGGNFNIATAPGRGTEITVDIPWRQ